VKPARLSVPDGATNDMVRAAEGETEKSLYDKRQTRPTYIAAESLMDYPPARRRSPRRVAVMNSRQSRQQGVDKVPASTRLPQPHSGAATSVDVEHYLAGRRVTRQVSSGAAAARHSRRHLRGVLRAKREA